MDAVFRALADPTRRLLLDRLRADNGQTLRELCEHLAMARQSATQHLDVLQRANLVTVVRRGRERLHYLNPAPIHEIEQRWISGFDRPRLRAISAIKERAERGDPVPAFTYTTYLRASAEQVWQALTDAELTVRYCGHANVSDWRPGSGWQCRRADGTVGAAGRVLTAEAQARLVVTVDDAAAPRGPSVVTVLIEPDHGVVRLTVTHDRLADPKLHGRVALRWPAVLSSLKSWLETGEALPEPVAGRTPEGPVT